MDAYRPLVEPYMSKYSLTVPTSTGYSQGSNGGALNGNPLPYTDPNTENEHVAPKAAQDTGIYQQPATQNGMLL